MYPPRIVLSPKALAVAGALLPSLASGSATTSDAGLGLLLGLAPNTVNVALRELLGHGALRYGRQARAGVRRLTLVPTCWVWIATAQVLGSNGVST